MWYRIRVSKSVLLLKEECAGSEVTEEAASCLPDGTLTVWTITINRDLWKSLLVTMLRLPRSSSKHEAWKLVSQITSYIYQLSENPV
jgi:hypothetical protein